MKRRIFLAVDLPPELKQQIAETIKQWHWLPIRWLAPENWHITLVPPVYLEEPELGLLMAALKRHRFGRPLTVRFSQAILAPSGIPARMIWLGGATPAELPQLKKKLEQAWASLGPLSPPKIESQPFSLHVTLARFEPGELKELEQKTRVLGEVDFAFEAHEVAVVESHLKPSGVAYETLARFPI